MKPSQGFSYRRSPDLHWLSATNGWAAYHRRLGGLCVMDDGAKRLLDSFATPQSLAPEVLFGAPSSQESPLIRQFVSRGFLELTNKAIETEATRAAPYDRQGRKVWGGIKVVQLVLANACNFGCTYCFEGIQGAAESTEATTGHDLKPSRNMTVNLSNSVYATARRISSQSDPSNRLMSVADACNFVGNAIEMAKAASERDMMIQFFGGEPLLNWQAINAVLQAYGNGENHGIRLVYSIVTNGSLVTEAIAETLARYQVAVCVSFDSPKSDSRRLKNGTDSKPVVKEGLKRLAATGNRIALNAALSSDTWGYCDETLVEFALSLGIQEIGIVLDLSPSFYEEFGAERIVDRLWTLVAHGRRQGVVLTGYWHQIYQLITAFDGIASRGFKMCSAKGRQLSIEPDGSVFSCKGASGYFGNIAEKDALLQSHTYQEHARLALLNPAPCRGCEIESFCSGFCLGPLEKKYGQIDVVEPITCEVYRGITRRLIQELAPAEIPLLSYPAKQISQAGEIL